MIRKTLIKITPESIERAFDKWRPKLQPQQPVVASGGPLSLDSPNVCPYCKAAMRPSTAVGIDVFVCDSDRHVAPAANKE